MPTVGGYVNEETSESVISEAKKLGISPSRFVGIAVQNALTASRKNELTVSKKDEDIELKKLQVLHRIENEKKAIGRLLNQVARHCNIHKRIDLGVLRALEEIERKLDDK